MKWFSIVAICASIVITAACEKHPVSSLPPELRGDAKHGEVKHAEVKHDAKPEAAKPATDAKPGEAPKFFPENK